MFELIVRLDLDLFAEVRDAAFSGPLPSYPLF